MDKDTALKHTQSGTPVRTKFTGDTLPSYQNRPVWIRKLGEKGAIALIVKDPNSDGRDGRDSVWVYIRDLEPITNDQ